MKKIFERLTFLALIPFSVILGSIDTTYSFSTSQVIVDTVEIEGNNYNSIFLENGNNKTCFPGDPSLPVKEVLFIIKPDEKVTSVSITSLDSTTILTNALPLPLPFQNPLDSLPFIEPSFHYYSKQSPGAAAKVMSHLVSADAHLVKIRLCPVQFDPVTRDLKLYTNIGISLQTSETSMQTMAILCLAFSLVNKIGEQAPLSYKF